MDLKEKLTPKHTALIIIDIQNDFASPDSQYFRASRGGDLSLVDPMVDNLERIIPLAEKVGVTVLYTQQIYDRNKLNDLQIEQYDLDNKLITCDIKTDGYKFYRIRPPKEKVYPKYNYNIFSNIDLINTLQKNKIKTIVLTGMDIIFCIETAVRVGFDLGYKIVVPKDMVAGNAKSNDLNDKTFKLIDYSYGVVISSSDLVDIWNNKS